MVDENTQPAVDAGPPPLDDPALKGKPHHIEARMVGLEPELREYVEKLAADKQNFARNFALADERARKTEVRLNEMLQKEQSAEKTRLEEQGKFKELADLANARVVELESKLSKREIQSNLDRELQNAGAVESELLSTALQSKYADELKADPARASELVARLKEEKPLLFRTAAPEPTPEPGQPAPAQKPTGQPGSQPQPGVQASPYNALDKSHKMSDVEREYMQAMKNASY